MKNKTNTFNIVRNWGEGTPRMSYDFDISLKTLIDLAYQSYGVSALWIDSIEIMESNEKINYWNEELNGQ